MASRLLSRRVCREFICGRYARWPECLPELWCERTDLITARTMATEAKKCVTLDNMNEHIKVMEYAVRGPLVIRAREIELELEKVGIKYDYVLTGRLFV